MYILVSGGGGWPTIEGLDLFRDGPGGVLPATPMPSFQSTIGTGYRRHCTITSQFPLVKFFAQFQMNGARFSLVFPTNIQFCTQILVFYYF